MKTRNIFLIFGIFLYTHASFSAEQCLSGDESNDHLIKQFNTARQNSPVMQNIFENYRIGSTTESADCAECKNGAKGNVSELKDVASAADNAIKAPHLLFKSECLQVGASFKTGTNEVLCPGNKFTSARSCLNQTHLNYENAVVSNFLSCLKSTGLKTLDATTLFQLLSLESAFKPNYSSSSGTGAGQLTSIYVADIHQEHRGKKYLRTIATSSQPECSAAKMIAMKDIGKTPSIDNKCAFSEFGEGLERNVLYSMVGMVTSWEKDISPKLESYLQKHKNHPKIKEVEQLSLLNSFGPGGRSSARAAITRLSSLSPDKFLEAMKRPMRATGGRNLTVYINRIKARESELSSKLPEPIKSEFASRGADACLTK